MWTWHWRSTKHETENRDSLEKCHHTGLHCPRRTPVSDHSSEFWKFLLASILCSLLSFEISLRKEATLPSTSSCPTRQTQVSGNVIAGVLGNLRGALSLQSVFLGGGVCTWWICQPTLANSVKLELHQVHALSESEEFFQLCWEVHWHFKEKMSQS